MPELSRFYGIIVTLNYDDHAPPHFHARYGDRRAAIALDGVLIAGSLPPRALELVRSWTAAHSAELQDDWDRARAQLPLVPIAPLD
jgi:hypothetical protein